MNTTQFQQGLFSWVDLATSDTEAASSFYGKLFGWTYQEHTAGPAPYIIIQKNDQAVGALYPLGAEMAQQEVPPHWLCYVAVDDAEAMTVKVQELGGRVIMGPHDAGESGRMTVAVDPTGAHFALWQAKKHAGYAVQNESGSSCWHELLSTNPDAAANFYQSLFGWAKQDMNMGMPYGIFSLGEKQVGGLMATPMPTMPSTWLVYWKVDDVDKTIATSLENGGKALMEPKEVEGVGRFVALMDPQGAVFCVLGPKN